ncbi:MAG: hypothetical protein JST16_17115 [Bdellovibrionales bacterium]|nr:hypothetical protein [Bdellovibrionales bacterium]
MKNIGILAIGALVSFSAFAQPAVRCYGKTAFADTAIEDQENISIEALIQSPTVLSQASIMVTIEEGCEDEEASANADEVRSAKTEGSMNIFNLNSDTAFLLPSALTQEKVFGGVVRLNGSTSEVDCEIVDLNP